ncbi:MAG: hypothetical protein O2960_06055 [Verrucomicrobia bacterium]|nr:hypothetical protein [Verrucomicrobiota bacterium]
MSGRKAQIEIPEQGFSLDVLPSVGADGHTIEMKVEFALKNPSGTTTAGPASEPKQPTSVSTSVVLWDGQTIAFGGFPMERNVTRNGETLTERKNLQLFLTPTIVDPAGNRVNTDDNRPYNPNVAPFASEPVSEPQP